MFEAEAPVFPPPCFCLFSVSSLPAAVVYSNPVQFTGCLLECLVWCPAEKGPFYHPLGRLRVRQCFSLPGKSLKKVSHVCLADAMDCVCCLVSPSLSHAQSLSSRSKRHGIVHCVLVALIIYLDTRNGQEHHNPCRRKKGTACLAIHLRHVSPLKLSLV